MVILTVGAGAGAQEILFREEGAALESSAKMVMPSMTAIVGRRISSATDRREEVLLTVTTMGGDMMNGRLSGPGRSGEGFEGWVKR